ncbi:MAG: 50S ribosomal protein L11 [Nanoarchaeota archaeon]|jgi:large subunit ribosomal protein L11|nr:50S ribosomal protein L11 [Nanoarchaeota archaeon]
MQVKLLVDGGAMKPGPAVSQSLGPAGINVNDVIAKVNEATKGFSGMQVPVTITVDTKNKTFDIEVLSPPISGMLKKEAGITKGSGIQKKVNSANLSIEQIIKVANNKLPNLLCKDLKAAVKIAVGSAGALGMLIESKSHTEIQEEINNGVYDTQINNIVTEPSTEKLEELQSYFGPLNDAQVKANAPKDDDGKKKK